MSVSPRWAVLAVLVVPTVAGAAEPAQPAAPVVRSAKSGPWSAASTWEGGKTPSAGVKVLIRQGHTVLYDVRSEDVIRSVSISGVLTFATDRDTLLNAG